MSRKARAAHELRVTPRRDGRQRIGGVLGRFIAAKAWRRATRFAGGFLIGFGLWAVVFAASAATLS